MGSNCTEHHICCYHHHHHHQSVSFILFWVFVFPFLQGNPFVFPFLQGNPFVSFLSHLMAFGRVGWVMWKMQQQLLLPAAAAPAITQSCQPGPRVTWKGEWFAGMELWPWCKSWEEIRSRKLPFWLNPSPNSSSFPLPSNWPNHPEKTAPCTLRAHFDMEVYNFDVGSEHPKGAAAHRDFYIQGLTVLYELGSDQSNPGHFLSTMNFSIYKRMKKVSPSRPLSNQLN